MTTRADGSLDPTLPGAAHGLTPDHADTIAATRAGAPSTGERRATLSGYEIGELLGEGGMGEVRLAHDANIGRDVAVKRMRHAAPSDEAIVRFLREARIQARLDHPAVVPVHELGEDADGRPYFTMKRIPSATLQDQLARGDVPKARLLHAFVDVCLAIDFAHARGFVHRDLKPTNISLGDYGEVYVLDWGIARSLGDNLEAKDGTIPTLDGATQAGALLGTPGYMAPEQARGEPVGTAADVYALGCMLFEILAGEALHPRGTHEAIASTIGASTKAPAERRPDRAIAPELDTVCVEALAAEPADRPSARELADRVQAYLDGDRDTERRRVLAAAELDAARAAFERDGGEDGRAEAVRRAGRAVVLDPESSDAAAFVLELLVAPPRKLPQELERELEAQQGDVYARASRTGAYGALTYFAFLPILLWMGVRDWFALGATYATVTAIFALTTYQARTRKVWPMALLTLNALQMIPMSMIFGPFVFVPAIVCIFAMTTTGITATVRPIVVLLACCVAFVVPVALQALGWMHCVWTIEDGRITLESTAMHIGGPGTLSLLIVGNLGAIAVAAFFARSMAGARDDAHRRLEIQAWHLRQLLPVPTPRPTSPPVTSCALPQL